VLALLLAPVALLEAENGVPVLAKHKPSSHSTTMAFCVREPSVLASSAFWSSSSNSRL
jgi:hypothetical protein